MKKLTKGYTDAQIIESINLTTDLLTTDGIKYYTDHHLYYLISSPANAIFYKENHQKLTRPIKNHLTVNILSKFGTLKVSMCIASLDYGYNNFNLSEVGRFDIEFYKPRNSPSYLIFAYASPYAQSIKSRFITHALQLLDTNAVSSLLIRAGLSPSRLYTSLQQGQKDNNNLLSSGKQYFFGVFDSGCVDHTDDFLPETIQELYDAISPHTHWLLNKSSRYS